MQYKVSFIFMTIGQFLLAFNVFLGVYFMFLLFPTVKGYSFQEVLLCFSIVLIQFSLAECFVRGFDMFSSIIGNGEFDRIMVRPRNEIFQILGSKIELTRVGRLLQAVLMFSYGVHKSQIDWSFDKVLTLILMIVGGFVVFSGIFLVYAALCFFTTEGLEFMNVLTDGAKEYGKYPISIYGKRVLQFCTFIVPFALIQYYPLLYILGKSTNGWYRFLPLAACLFIIPCYLLWRLGVRHYKSTGS
jgi:ABC-2 type transport system permease protein